jgi:lysophospholipid acyltransferase (LPLAT)-like uncharacterized protein
MEKMTEYGKKTVVWSDLWIGFKAFLVWFVAKLLLMTVRVKSLNSDQIKTIQQEGTPIIYAFWHGRQLVLFKANPEKKLAVLASHSRDGEMQARICKRFGLEVVRGSSSRGGMTSLLGLSKMLKKKMAIGMAVDGPKGPVYSAKPGVVMLARQSGSPIVPITVGFVRSWQLSKTWDKFLVPKPFTTAYVAYGQPLYIGTCSSPNEIEKTTSRLSEKLVDLTAKVDSLQGEG